MNIRNKSISYLFFGLTLLLSYGWIQINNNNSNSDYKQNSFSKVVKTRHIKTSSYISDNQYKIDILHYDLKIELQPEIKLLIGHAELKGIILDNQLKQIDLNFYDNMKINSIYLNGKKVDYKNNKTRLSIFNKNSIKDTFIVSIDYEGTPKKLGLSSFVFGRINGKYLTYSLNEPEYASTWFPCNDIPSDKAMLDISIKSDSSKVSVSNGILVNKSTEGYKRTYHWKTLYPISTYLICLYSSDFAEFNDTYISVSSDTMPLNYYVLPERLESAKKDWLPHKDYIKVFEQLFGDYPFIKEKYGVAEFLWQMGAMEHQTITGIGTNFVDGEGYNYDIYVHELAHQWWGDAVGPATWADIWLNEGFATYSEALFEERVNGKHALKEKMIEQFYDNSDGTLYSPGEDLFSSKVYNKGAWVLHMLRWEIGDTNFFSLLKKYYQAFKYKNASTEDFKNLAENISGKNLDKFFKQWVYQGEGILKLDYWWKAKKTSDGYLLDITVEQVQKEYPLYQFPLEIKIMYQQDALSFTKKFEINSKVFSTQIKLNKYPNDIIIDPHKWLLAKIHDRNSYE